MTIRTAILRPVVLRLAAALLALTLVAACKQEVYSGLTEREANKMIAALMEIGIPAAKRPGADGMSVTVDGSRFAEAINHLDARGLPEVSYSNFGEVFQREGIVSSPMEERARYIYALSQELSQTIAEIDGVLSARVHVVLPESDMLGRDLEPSSASVFIRHTADAAVGNFVAQIKNLVANSIEGLVYDNVSVVTVEATGTATASRETQAPLLEDVLGVWVHPASVGRLWLILGAAAASVVLALGTFSVLVLRRRSMAAEAEFDGA